MTRPALLLPLLLICLTAVAAIPQEDPPVLKLDPPALVVDADSAGFVVTRVKFVNTGGGTATVSSVTGSCGCASASVQRNHASGITYGELRLGINAQSFKDSLNNVDFTVHSNAKNSPSVIRVVVRKHIDAKDTTR